MRNGIDGNYEKWRTDGLVQEGIMPIKPENYKRIRKHFIKILGSKCCFCGQVGDDLGKYIDWDGAKRTLEFDHIKPNGVRRHDVSRSVREWEWFDAFDSENLQLLCPICNKLKSDK